MPKTELDPNRPHLSVEDLEAEARSLAMDAQVADSRDFNTRVGGNAIEPGVYDPAQLVPDPVADPVTNEDTAEAVAAMDAQVAAANGGAAVSMTTGVETSAPTETKAPARAKNK